MQIRLSHLRACLPALSLLVLFLSLPGERAEAQGSFAQPLPGLSADQLSTFFAGKTKFERQWRRREGLGPLFNADACAVCHSLPDVGGIGPNYRSHFNFGLQDGDVFNPLKEKGGPLLQERAVKGVMREQVPDEANVFSLRRVPPLFGLGLVEAIPDAGIIALADEGDGNGDGISGRAVFNADGRVQRFGSQNHIDSLRNFVVKALEGEIGLTTEELPQETLTLMRSFIAFLAPLPRGEINEEVVQGEAVFNKIGCATCHVSSFTTSSGPFTTADGEVVDVAALQNQILFPYSDFLLHDMGPELDDGVALGSAKSSEYRTTPLWGARFRGSFLHDGRAANFRQAILFHGGETKAARKAYLSLSPQELNLLEAFLASL